jgi:hypothetical protein
LARAFPSAEAGFFAAPLARAFPSAEAGFFAAPLARAFPSAEAGFFAAPLARAFPSAETGFFAAPLARAFPSAETGFFAAPLARAFPSAEAGFFPLLPCVDSAAAFGVFPPSFAGVTPLCCDVCKAAVLSFAGFLGGALRLVAFSGIYRIAPLIRVVAIMPGVRVHHSF